MAVEIETILSGKFIKLVPLQKGHLKGLEQAAEGGAELYKWTYVPKNSHEFASYFDQAEQMRESGSGLAFSIISHEDGKIKGTSRYLVVP